MGIDGAVGSGDSKFSEDFWVPRRAMCEDAQRM